MADGSRDAEQDVSQASQLTTLETTFQRARVGSAVRTPGRSRMEWGRWIAVAALAVPLVEWQAAAGAMAVCGISAVLGVGLWAKERDLEEDEAGAAAHAWAARHAHGPVRPGQLDRLPEGSYAQVAGRLTSDETLSGQVALRIVRGEYRPLLGHELHWTLGGKAAEVVERRASATPFQHVAGGRLALETADGRRIPLSPEQLRPFSTSGRPVVLSRDALSGLLVDGDGEVDLQRVTATTAEECLFRHGDPIVVFGIRGGVADPRLPHSYREVGVGSALRGTAARPLLLFPG